MSETEYYRMSEMEFWQWHRAGQDHMRYYRKIYKNSKRLISCKLKEGSHIIVYGDMGHGDIIQMLRYLPALMKICKVTLHCPPALIRLVKSQCPSIGIVEKKDDITLPNHDAHIVTLDLPLFFNASNKPYIHITETLPDVKEYHNTIGIAYEGSPGNQNNLIRCCPLRFFKKLNGTLFLLQHELYLSEMFEDAEDMEVLSVPIKDFYDTAVLINSLDKIVTIDTAILHLAGAMGKTTYALLPYKPKADPRWGEEGEETIWYPSVRLIRQKSEGNWESCFADLNARHLVS